MNGQQQTTPTTEEIIAQAKREARRTRVDAGRMGGNVTKEKYGDSGFYSTIGSLGGKARGEK